MSKEASMDIDDDLEALMPSTMDNDKLAKKQKEKKKHFISLYLK